MSLRSANKDQRGFTLIEVLIAIFIMTFIGLAIFQAVTESFKLRDVILNEGDFHNSIRFSIDVVQRDLSQLYSPVAIAPPKDKAPGQPDVPDNIAVNDPTGDMGQSFAFWTAAIDKTGIRPSRFVGTENKMTFVSVSHIRVYKDAPESEFAKITYELRRDQRRTETGETANGMILVKTEDTDAFDLEEGRNKQHLATYPLLPGIRSLRFRYYQKEKEVWHGSWDSDSQDFKNIFPDMIEITLEVDGPSKLNFQGRYLLRPEIPNNGIQSST